MDQTNAKLSPIKEIYCINCHEELILDSTEKKGEKDIVCPKCDTSFNLLDEHNFLKNLSPIVEGQCPSCWEELTFDIEDRASKDKIKCPLCENSFYITEAINPSTKILPKKEIDEEETSDNSIEDNTNLKSGEKVSKNGIVFGPIDKDPNQLNECRFCGRKYELENDFYCPSCGKPTLEVPTNKNINFFYDAAAELTDRVYLIYSKFLLNDLIPSVSRTVLLGLEPSNAGKSQDLSRNKPLEIRLCNSAILYGFAIRVAEELFWEEQEYSLPKDYYQNIKTVVKDNKFERLLPTNWYKMGLKEPLKGMLLSNYFAYYGFEDYVINTEYVQSALYKAIMFDSELQGAHLTYYNSNSIMESSKTMIRIGYILGMQLSITGDEDRELGTKAFLSENYKKLLK